MEDIFEHQIKKHIERLKENSFQDFITNLLVMKHGSQFTPIRQKKDKGCDGIIENRTVIAVYAPPKGGLREFKKKVADDYGLYLANWHSKYPNWCYVYNEPYTAEMIKCFDELDPSIEKWDINHVMNIFRELNWAKKRDMAARLGIDENYFINDILKNVVDDLIRSGAKDTILLKHKRPVYIEDKIELNFDNADIPAALTEYAEALPYLAELKNVLKSYPDGEIASLKSRVIVGFNKLSGDFKTKMNNLNEGLAERNKNDDIYKYYVRVVLIYFFEACLIGKKAEGEV